jgi:5-hydroxyisourate hydrolase
MNQLSCHVLDTANGQPASNIIVQLYDFEHQHCLAECCTDNDGRIKFGDITLQASSYTLRFLVAPYCLTQFGHAFFPMIEVHFTVTTERNVHIPLLLAPYSYSSYRGS